MIQINNKKNWHGSSKSLRFYIMQFLQMKNPPFYLCGVFSWLKTKQKNLPSKVLAGEQDPKIAIHPTFQLIPTICPQQIIYLYSSPTVPPT